MIPVGGGNTNAPDSPRFLIFAIFMDLFGELEVDVEYLAVCPYKPQKVEGTRKFIFLLFF